MPRTSPLLFSLLLLAACAGLPQPAAQRVQRDLGPAPSSPLRDFRMLGLEMRPVPELNGTAIRYRLEYADSGRLPAYRDSVWAADAPDLLAARLRQRLMLAPLRRECNLRVELDEFAHRFAAPGTGTGLIAARASVVDRAGNVVRNQVFRVERMAESGDARGATAALAQASDALAAELGEWLAGAPLCAGNDRAH